MSDKIDINMLRQAVGAKLLSIKTPVNTKRVKIFEGSHSFSFDNNDNNYQEHDEGTPHEEEHEIVDGIDPEKVKQNLFQISVYAAKLHDLLDGGGEVEEGVEDEIAEVVKTISDIYHHLEYKSYKESD